MSDETDRRLQVNTRQAQSAGGCMVCNRYNTETGCENHQVFEIHLGNCAVRVCDDCRLALIELLMLHGRPGQPRRPRKWIGIR